MTSKDKNNEVFCSHIKLDEQNKLCRVEAICFRTLKKLKKQLLDSTQLITPIIQQDFCYLKKINSPLPLRLRVNDFNRQNLVFFILKQVFFKNKEIGKKRNNLIQKIKGLSRKQRKINCHQFPCTYDISANIARVHFWQIYQRRLIMGNE